jgi:putative transcriptional regulator
MKQIVWTALFCGGMLVLPSLSVMAQQEFMPSSVHKGALLVASPSVGDPNFTHTVLLIVEHGQGGTIGLILNRPTDVLLAEVLQDLPVLKQTNHRLFSGGPVGRTQLVLLFRLREILPDARHIANGIYVGTPMVLERVIAGLKPNEAFRAFAGFAGWAPGQLESEMRQGSWGVLSSSTFDIFNKDPETLWPDSIAGLQAPRTISHE